MSRSEFELIRRYFSQAETIREDVQLGIGDDCALLQVPAGKLLAVSMDTLVSGVHFLPDAAPETLGHKALAANLSDLAAMAAVPAWATLSVTLPRDDPDWLEAFSRGFLRLAKRYRVQLVGGDTCHGPLSLTVQVHGLIDTGCALRRDQAQVGDLVYVTGELGAAALALEWIQARQPETVDLKRLRTRLELPIPRLTESLALAAYCHAAIDLSDGLLADLGHVCHASGVGARIDLQRLPMDAAVSRQVRERDAWNLPLAGGDDYELCLTVPADRQSTFEQAAARLTTAVTRIGVIEAEAGIRCLRADASQLQTLPGGYDHFAHG